MRLQRFGSSRDIYAPPRIRDEERRVETATLGQQLLDAVDQCDRNPRGRTLPAGQEQADHRRADA